MTPSAFLGAYILDMIAGDPRWVPHPVVIIGRAIGFLEDAIRKLTFVDNKKGGIILWFAVVLPVYLIAWFVVEGSFAISFLVGTVVTIVLASTTLATRSLFNESKIVIDALDEGDIVEARRRLSMIVGRDTENLDERGILRAVIETVAENLSDGIIAPMFYLALGGLPLAMAYKAVNTLDSMVGYNNEKYGDIGCFSAKIDDVCNWVPARLTGFIIVAVSFILRLNWKDSFRIMRRDGRNHSSPNSGVPEAAIAGALGIRLGGRIQYFGRISDKPSIGDEIKEMDRKDVTKAWAVMFLSSLMMAVVCAMALLIASL